MRKDVAYVPATALWWGERRLRLMKLRHRDTDLSKLITGRPACERPLARLNVFKHLHVAIDKEGVVSSAASAEDDDAGFKGDLGVDQGVGQDEPLAKRLCVRVGGFDFIAVTAQRTPGQPLEGTQDIIFENTRVLAMDLGEHLENLTWLTKAVRAERANPDQVSVVSPRA